MLVRCLPTLLMCLLLIQPVVCWADWITNIYDAVVEKIEAAKDYFKNYFGTEKWNCGSKHFPGSSFSAKQLFGLCFQKLSKNVNDYCMTHDKCYNDQSGQKLCDDQFCAHLKDVKEELTKEEASLTCRSATDGICNAVRKFGHIAYERAGAKKKMQKQRGY